MSKTRKSRSRSASKGLKKASTGPFKSGRVTRNPFLNFLRDFRKSNNGLTLTELTRRAAELWRKMNDRQRSPYCQLAKQAPRRRKKRKRSRRRRRRKRRRGRSYSSERDGSYGSDSPIKYSRRDDDVRCRKKKKYQKEYSASSDSIDIDD